jgi:hypothetical protein
MQRGDSHGPPPRFTVNLDVAVTGLVTIDIAGNQLTLQLSLTSAWSDPRLSFFNLKAAGRQTNLLPANQWADIYTPTVKFWSTRGAKLKRYED